MMTDRIRLVVAKINVLGQTSCYRYLLTPVGMTGKFYIYEMIHEVHS